VNDRDVPEGYVAGAFALQGIPLREGAAERIAAALAAQTTVVAPAYAALAFEEEPAGYERVRDELAR
jgi:hypothetical protein